MALIKSISGIRGTIGGKPTNSLSPLDVVKFTAAYAEWLKQQNQDKKNRYSVVVGRDGRISGPYIQQLVISTLVASGIDVINLDLSTTPTVEMAVGFNNADGGIIITASHNGAEWNALKLLNGQGEFLSAADGESLLALADSEAFGFVAVDKLGTVTNDNFAMEKHIETIVQLPMVDVEAIKKKKFKVVVDCINSTGAIAVPALLKALGVKDIILLNEEVNGKFAHNPEPLPQHLNGICNEVKKLHADIGIAVDPDVDRLCFICEDGSLFGEEYTLVAVADYVLQQTKGNTVSNLSSTRALKDVTVKHGGEYFPSAVGEVNVVTKMKEVNAVIGGEGNGGVILPQLHYGRDALAGIALFLTYLAKNNKSVLQLRKTYPDYFISKNKIELSNGVNTKSIFEQLQRKYKNHPVNTEDGLKIEFDKDWVHLRTSNTEPIIRIYAESNFETTADNIARRLMADIKEYM
ncbi:phosphoglucosamine mutase [Parafilimonas terrae]|uniref:Phosphomannomutase n=1 Tax=Parafilimonas terrae TaxID=1465490 RepID=A0A1I5U7S4_9BACT|nr:phosphoglucosamine mutase [Parafilimonas terrae]SFP90676.1 phosphomannomutase [Parafilimonas terrae]